MAAAVAWWALGRPASKPADVQPSRVRAIETRPPAPPAAEEPPAASAAAPAIPGRATRKAEAAPPSPAAPATGELHIDADVPDAIAFLDRVYLGKVPVTTKDVTPGSHRLNVSAEGHEGIAQTIEVEPGSQNVMIRFKEVRLSEAIEVVHKHTFGSCAGRLAASTEGLRYETDTQADAFAVSFDRVETFEVDYLKKNLRVKIRGGKTYNFTDRNENADALFVFHRNVTKAREKMK
jgi:hypothetical protein